ncbi:fumarylacetoacetate hydrolase family protein [Calditrichota bacterium]
MMVKTNDLKEIKPFPAADRGDGRIHRIDSLLRKAAEKNFVTAELPFTLESIIRAENSNALVQFIEEYLDDAPVLNEDEFTFDLPVTTGDIFCIGRNYAEHARELNNPLPAEPVLFMKPRSSLIPSGEIIYLPNNSDRVELEGELALIIGRKVFGKINPEKALSAIFGVTLLNDVTDRGKQSELKKEGKPWIRAKGADTFAPCGPAIFFLENKNLIKSLNFTTTLNNEIVQKGNVENWLWSAGELIVSIASTITLRPCDIIATGTPAGVKKIDDGDRIIIESPLIGRLENLVKNRKKSKIPNEES